MLVDRLSHTAVLIAVIGAVVYLAACHVVTGSDAMGILGAALGLSGGVTATQLGGRLALTQPTADPPGTPTAVPTQPLMPPAAL